MKRKRIRVDLTGVIDTIVPEIKVDENVVDDGLDNLHTVDDHRLLGIDYASNFVRNQLLKTNQN